MDRQAWVYCYSVFLTGGILSRWRGGGYWRKREGERKVMCRTETFLEFPRYKQEWVTDTEEGLEKTSN